MNPYQRIEREGKLVQRGHIDTRKKFEQLLNGVSLEGKRVLDVGCNLGEMMVLAKSAGADFVRGIDKDREYIRQARELNPGLVFDVGRAENCVGPWDVIIASAMLHYCDLPAALDQFARCAQLVICDVWVDIQAGRGSCMVYNDERGLLVPSMALFERLAGQRFGSVKEKGPALSPDGSVRRIYHLSEPKPKAAKCLIVGGVSHSGKTTMGRELVAGERFEHLQLDEIFLDWRISREKRAEFSVSDFVRQVQAENEKYIACGVDKGSHRFHEYLEFHHDYIFKWLGSRMCRDVIIEGYDLLHSNYRVMVENLARELHWSDVEYRELKHETRSL